MEKGRGYRDRDYLETTEGFLFCVIGPVHPRSRIISYLKYIPDETGKWGRKGKKFKRIMQHYIMPDLVSTLKILEQYRDYLFDSEVLGIRMSAVPLDKIRIHHKPEVKLSQLIESKNLDNLQKKTVDLATLISDESGVPIECLGVTGSILLNIHRDFSDIDLVVYGMKNSLNVKERITQMYDEDGSPIRRISKEAAERWCIEKTEMYPLTYREAAEILKRKWNRGTYHGTMFSIYPVKIEDEVHEEYGDRIFKYEGMIKLYATVNDATEAEFLPSVYKVEDVKVIEGKTVNDLTEITSYETFYGGIADRGDRVEAYGKLERVIDRISDVEYHRVLIGSKEAMGKDYIKPLL